VFSVPSALKVRESATIMCKTGRVVKYYGDKKIIPEKE